MNPDPYYDPVYDCTFLITVPKNHYHVRGWLFLRINWDMCNAHTFVADLGELDQGSREPGGSSVAPS
eukprot:6056028-Pyramimonas_sp.AAC.1